MSEVLAADLWASLRRSSRRAQRRCRSRRALRSITVLFYATGEI